MSGLSGLFSIPSVVIVKLSNSPICPGSNLYRPFGQAKYEATPPWHVRFTNILSPIQHGWSFVKPLTMTIVKAIINVLPIILLRDCFSLMSKVSAPSHYWTVLLCDVECPSLIHCRSNSISLQYSLVIIESTCFTRSSKENFNLHDTRWPPNVALKYNAISSGSFEYLRSVQFQVCYSLIEASKTKELHKHTHTRQYYRFLLELIYDCRLGCCWSMVCTVDYRSVSSLFYFCKYVLLVA